MMKKYLKVLLVINMLVYKNGDILNATENIICHQVNADGVMGGGLALQIAKLYPEVENKYKKFCRCYNYDYEKLKGNGYMVPIGHLKFIENCFTQKPNFDTDYEALKKCFTYLMQLCKAHSYSICVPYGYGCGIAHGDWNIVSKIFEDLSNEYEVDILVYRLENAE